MNGGLPTSLFDGEGAPLLLSWGADGRILAVGACWLRRLEWPLVPDEGLPFEGRVDGVAWPPALAAWAKLEIVLVGASGARFRFAGDGRDTDGGGGLFVGRPRSVEERGPLDVMSRVNNELVDLSRTLAKRNAELEEARSKIRVLSGLLPICAYCKKIRNDGGYWSQLECYIREHSEAMFSHGICPDCSKKLMDELDEES